MSYIKFGEYEPERETIITDKKNGNSMEHTYEFSNGYGAIVIQDKAIKGHEDGLYRLGILKGGELCYRPPTMCKVVEDLSADEVAERLSQIEKFTKKGAKA